MTKKHICVIGAGLSGIVTIKELQEKNLKVTCFEKSKDIGGVFSGKNTYDSVLLTVSNYFMAYSDFMPTDERLRFWTGKEYKKYLTKYINHFDLNKSIQFETDVLSIKKLDNQWEVTTHHHGSEKKYFFDAVAICSGQFQKRKIPSIAGMGDFRGKIYHSTDYKNAEPFKNKKVLCIGLGESSADITSEISDVAQRTILSLRRYPLVVPRYLALHDNRAYNPKSYTVDVFNSRYINCLPKSLYDKDHIELFQRYVQSDDPATSLMGKWVMASITNNGTLVDGEQVLTKNERIFEAIADNKVQAKIGDIQKITANTVVFHDHSAEEIDTIMFCTGFEFSLPFIDLLINSSRELYKHMFYPDFDNSLALIGFIRPAEGGVPALAELQARYFALLCTNEKQLPDRAIMLKQIKQDKKHWEEEFSITPHVTSLLAYPNYSEDLARCIGCEFKVHPRKEKALFNKCWYGPLWGIQYRLRGPGARPEKARQILLTKTPIPYMPPLIVRWFSQVMMCLRALLPIKSYFKPRKL